MSATRRSPAPIVLTVFLLLAGAWLWSHHAAAWDLGRSSPVLGYDAAQYAVAARELAEHGRLATTFALPLELSAHASPPWPLALVQPGLVLVEAAWFRIAGDAGSTSARHGAPGSPERVEWLVLALPVACYLALGIVLALAALRLLSLHAAGISPLARAGAAGVLGLSFLLDPQAQHYAAGGFTELPFALGLSAALLTLALGVAPRRPLLFGLLLGLTGAFRGNMLWLAPLLAIAAAAIAPPQRRVRVAAAVLLGYAVPLAPWWIYKWHAFGSPAWDLSWVSLWDGVQGRTWFSLNHLPSLPALPSGAVAAGEMARKLGRNLPALLLDLTVGPQGLWLAALLLWPLAIRPPRPLAAAALAAFGVLAVSTVVGAASVPIVRYLFPARVAADAAGVLALWGLCEHAPPSLIGAGGRRGLRIAIAVLALGWGAWQTARGSAEARAATVERGVPSTAAMIELVERLDREIPRGEPVMSNLGPILAWYDRRPVVHLALSPADVDACRRRLDLRHVVLVFRAPERAWPEWIEVLERPEEAPRHPEWNITAVRRFETHDGFRVVWLELGPLTARMAEAGGGRDRGEARARRYLSLTSRRVNVRSSTVTRAR